MLANGGPPTRLALPQQPAVIADGGPPALLALIPQQILTMLCDLSVRDPCEWGCFRAPVTARIMFQFAIIPIKKLLARAIYAYSGSAYFYRDPALQCLKTASLYFLFCFIFLFRFPFAAIRRFIC